MPDNMKSATSQDFQSPELIRQGYSVEVVDGHKVLIPDVVRGLGLPLASIRQPNVTDAVNMDKGVSIFS